MLCGCSTSAAKNPYSKDAACPSEATRASSFTKVYDQVGNRSVYTTRECDYLTFIGNATEGSALNPVLDNAHELTGALLSRFDPIEEVYVDKRMLSEKQANPHARIGIDFQAGLQTRLQALQRFHPHSMLQTALHQCR
jgi:hypothetical protein